MDIFIGKHYIVCLTTDQDSVNMLPNTVIYNYSVVNRVNGANEAFLLTLHEAIHTCVYLDNALDEVIKLVDGKGKMVTKPTLRPVS